VTTVYNCVLNDKNGCEKKFGKYGITEYRARLIRYAEIKILRDENVCKHEK
jgi:hypothetical protein